MSSVAILGGGISGLSGAYYLLERCLKQGIDIGKVYLLEEQSRFGGWLQSLPVTDDRRVHFELGPRTISLNSYAGANVLALVDSIGLSDQIKKVTKDSQSFKRRYVVIDNQLRPLPNRISDLFVYRKPFKPFITYLARDLRRPPVKIGSDDDISVHDFFQYRLGDEVANYLINPLCIGITGGDSRNLSMRSVFGGLFQKEQTYGSVVRGMFGTKEDIWKDLRQNDLVRRAIEERWAVFSFQQGIETLTDRLKCILASDRYGGKIHLLNDTPVTGLNFSRGKINIRAQQSNGNQIDFSVDHIFSAIPAIKLARLLPTNDDRLVRLRQTLASIRTVHMALACLQYDRQVLPTDKGFGFLVPASENSNILGTTFDSCIFPSESTQLTVMLGGYRFQKLFGPPEQVDRKKILNISVRAIKSYLKIADIPTRHHVAVHQDCIPQYAVGHQTKLRAIEQEISGLNLSLLGASYYGFSVPDTILNAKVQTDRWVDEIIQQRIH